MKRKVAIFYKTFRKFGGQEKVVYEFSHFLASKGYEVHIWTTKIKDRPETENIKLHRVTIPNLGRGFRNLAFSVYAFVKGKKLKKEDFILFGFGKTFFQDIFRAGGGVHKVYIERSVLKFSSPLRRKLYQLKKLLSLSNWINRGIERLTFESENLKKLIVPSLFVEKQIRENFKVKAEIIIIRNGVNLQRFQPPTREEKENLKLQLNVKSNFTFVYISSNFLLKGLEYLLEATRLLNSKNFLFSLLIAGTGSEDYFQEKAKRYKLNNVRFLGKRKDVETVYKAGDFFVYPTLFDASANVILEALASGLPVISSTYAGTHELIIPGKNGFLINHPEKPEEIAKAMELALKLPKERLHEMSKYARETAENYPAEKVFHEYEQVIKSI